MARPSLATKSSASRWRSVSRHRLCIRGRLARRKFRPNLCRAASTTPRVHRAKNNHSTRVSSKRIRTSSSAKPRRPSRKRRPKKSSVPKSLLRRQRTHHRPKLNVTTKSSIICWLTSSINTTCLRSSSATHSSSSSSSSSKRKRQPRRLPGPTHLSTSRLWRRTIILVRPRHPTGAHGTTPPGKRARYSTQMARILATD